MGKIRARFARFLFAALCAARGRRGARPHDFRMVEKRCTTCGWTPSRSRPGRSSERAVTRLRTVASRSPEAELRRVVASRTYYAAAPDMAEWLANEQVERAGSRKARSRAARRRWHRSLARRRRRA